MAIDNSDAFWLAHLMRLGILRTLNAQIEVIEQRVKEQIALKPEFRSLLSVDGIGNILGQTIALEPVTSIGSPQWAAMRLTVAVSIAID